MAKNDGQGKVRVDIKENILHIIVSGRIRAKNLESIYTDIRFGVADLKPGFAVITDMTEASIAHLSCISVFTKITTFLQASKVGPVFRITSKDGIILNQILRATASLQDYPIMYVAGVEEAKAEIHKIRQQESVAASANG